MTQDKGEENVVTVIQTVKGQHARGHYNQREIDVIQSEVLPNLTNNGSVGIITPYRNQAEAINRQLGTKKSQAPYINIKVGNATISS